MPFLILSHKPLDVCSPILLNIISPSVLHSTLLLYMHSCMWENVSCLFACPVCLYFLQKYSVDLLARFPMVIIYFRKEIGLVQQSQHSVMKGKIVCSDIFMFVYIMFWTEICACVCV